jgi:DNA polymerase elongation subunit (family B)
MEVVNAFVDGPDLIILEREGDRIVEHKTRPEYSFFVETEQLQDVDFARQIRSASVVRAMVSEGRWTRIVWSDDFVRKEMLYGRLIRSKNPVTGEEERRRNPSPFQTRGITTYEGDVDPVRRWFTDTGATIAKPRRAYFDLETDSRVNFAHAKMGRSRIISIAACTEDESKKFLQVINAWSDSEERRIISAFFDWIDEVGADQLIAWNGDGFDFLVLRERIERLGLNLDMRRKNWLDHMVLFRRMNMNSSDSGEEKQSMALNAIAFAQLGEGKEEIPPEVAKRWPGRSLGSLSYELWEAGGEFRELLTRYNMKDTLLMPRIERKTGYIALFDTLADVCRVLPNSVGLQPTKQMDGFMLRLALERKHHFATKVFREKGEEEERDQFAGAFVMQPRTVGSKKKEDDWTPDQAEAWRLKMKLENGILRDVHVADFASLYPSIIITWNMSPETKLQNAAVNGPIAPGTCRSPLTGVCFDVTVEGILPAALKTMIAMRKVWSDRAAKLPPGTPEAKEAQRRSMAYKVAANSFYGVVGSPFSRYFDREVAESVTQNGVWLIKRTIAEAEERGMEVLYGDTDSFFAMNVTQTEYEAFVSWCNDTLYPDILQKVGCTENRIKLAYEKAFSLVMFTAKKRYAGCFLHYKGTAAKPVPGEGEVFDKKLHSRPEIKGFEYKRGDVSVLARRLQEKAIMTLMRGVVRPEAYRQLLSEALTHVATAELPLEEVQISKSLSQETKKYHRKTAKGADQAVPPHVRVAEVLEAKGLELGEGSRVSYVVTDSSDGIKAIPAQDYKGQIDRYYLWESMVYPPTQRLLQAAFPAQDWVTGLERIRPKQTRGKRVLPGQESLFGDAADPIGEHARKLRHLETAWVNAMTRSLEAEVAWRG